MITQIYYNVATYGPLTSANPGPSDRGNCFFFGQISTTTSMDPYLIDNQRVKFNLSAWIGNQTTIGPVLAADRGSQSSLLFRQATDYVPIGTRSFTAVILITCFVTPSNDDSIDNIGIYLYT